MDSWAIETSYQPGKRLPHCACLYIFGEEIMHRHAGSRQRAVEILVRDVRKRIEEVAVKTR